MKKCFWNDIPKPLLVLAPMADVTDPAFRRIIAKYGKPDILYTQFVSADGLSSEGQERLLRYLEYSETERPIVAQIFGAHPDTFFQTAKLLKKLGFDGIDINMGCPERKIQKQNACAALMKEPNLAQEIIQATKEGAGGLPVTVKTRIGYNQNEIETWIPALLEADPVALIIHGRTKKEMSKVKAHWDAIARAVEIRNERQSKCLILGNGDVGSIDEARSRAKESGVDGVMIGRGIFGNPWFFGKTKREELPLSERLRVMVEHTKLFEELIGDIKNFAVMKKHFRAYVDGFQGAKDLRMKLMETENSREVETIVNHFLHGSYDPILLTHPAARTIP